MRITENNMSRGIRNKGAVICTAKLNKCSRALVLCHAALTYIYCCMSFLIAYNCSIHARFNSVYG